jgi:DNA-binding GntR family transcriptional regulator
MTAKTMGKLAPLHQQPAPLRNKIITALRSAIEIGLLRPGDRLVERDLCEQLAVSRTSLREALRELQAVGVLTHSENRGLAVVVLTAEDAVNAYRLRAVVEALAVEQFIEHADDAERDQLAADGSALKKAYLSGSVERILARKRQFYDCICSGAKNDLALDIINRLVLRTSSLRSRSLARKERQQQSVKEIEAILTAIRGKDVAAAKAAATRHVENAARSALGTSEASSDAGTARTVAKPRSRRTAA